MQSCSTNDVIPLTYVSIVRETKCNDHNLHAVLIIIRK